MSVEVTYPTCAENDVDLAPDRASCAGCGSLATLHRVEPGCWHQSEPAWLCCICMHALTSLDIRRGRKPRPVPLFEWIDLDV
jgi:hypothetical protein